MWDETAEDLYYAFVKNLFDSNISKYEAQAKDLIRTKYLHTEVGGTNVRYKLSLRECLCEVSLDSGDNFLNKSRTRLGWRKKEKLQALPLLFAKTEASLLYKN